MTEEGDKGSSERAGVFATTHWSVVLGARDTGSSGAAEALARLCEAYWYPLYAFVRQRGNGPEESRDLTQAFFERFLAKDFLGDLTPGTGRFRSFLLATLKNFLANEWDRAQAQKRGSGRQILSLDEAAAEGRYELEPRDHGTPETAFERRWALAILERVLGRLRTEFVAGERAGLFEEFQPFLTLSRTAESYADVASRTGLKEGTVKVAVHRLRKRYGQLLREEIAHTVQKPGEVEDEIRHLIAVLSGA